jgi:PAS domain S-box-containing protein
MEKKTNRLIDIEKRLDLCLSAGNLAWWEMDCKTGKVIFNENKVKMLGYSMKDFNDIDYTAFTNLLHPEDHDQVMQAMKDHLDGKKKSYDVKYRIKTKKGNYKWFHDKGSIVQWDKERNPLLVKGVVFDITDVKSKEIQLKKLNESLEKIVQDRTKALELSNVKLKEEIKYRKDAEEYSNRTKQNLRNIIDSASEFIVSFDMNNRISIWNKYAENLTGYKEIEVLNRSVGKLDVFDNPNKIIDYIKKVCSLKVKKSEDFVLKTWDNEKKIIRVSGADIKSVNNECIGALFIGNDITQETELHKKLISGNSYIITDKDRQSAIDLLIDLSINEFKGLIITRGIPTSINKLKSEFKNIDIVILTKETHDKYGSISDLDILKNYIEDYTKKFKKTVILLDGIHYLIMRFSFEKFIDSLFTINDIVAKNKSLFFLRIDPLTIDENHMAILENELSTLPSQKIEDLILEDVVYDLLKYINNQNQINSIVSVKKLMIEFNIAYVTTANRLDSLEKLGLIFSKKMGKIRAIYITDKGKKILHARKPI